MPWQSHIRIILTDFSNMGMYVGKSLWKKIFAICCHVKTFCIWRMQNIPTEVLTCNTRSFWNHRLHRPQISKDNNVKNLTINCQFCWTYVNDADRLPLVATIFETSDTWLLPQMWRRHVLVQFLQRSTPGRSCSKTASLHWEGLPQEFCFDIYKYE